MGEGQKLFEEKGACVEKAELSKSRRGNIRRPFSFMGHALNINNAANAISTCSGKPC